MADIRLIIDVDASGVVKGSQIVRQEIDETAKTAQKGGSAFSSMWKQVAIGQIAAQAAMKAMQTLKDVVTSSINEAIKQEEAEKALEAALLTTGRTIQGNIEHYRQFAQAQQSVTKYADDEIMAAQALMLQMTNLNQKGIDEAIKGAMGLASTLKMDLQSATLLVAKAMEGNTAALSRYGIRVDESLPPQEKQAELLRQLSVLYGRATAETDTYAGKIAQLKNYIGDIKEAIGDVIIKNEDVIKLLDDFKKKAEALSKDKDFKLWLSAIAEEIGAVARATMWATDKIAKLGAAIGQLIGAHKSKAAQDKEIAEVNARLAASTERAIAAGAKAVVRTKEIIAAHKEEKAVINETGNAIKRATEEDEKAKKAKEDLKKAVDNILKNLFPLEAKIKDIIANQQKLNQAYRAGLIDIGTYQKGMSALEKELEKVTIGTQELAIVTEQSLKKWDKSFRGVLAIAPQIDKTYKKTFQDIDSELKKAADKIERYAQIARTVFSALDGVFQQVHKNEEIRIENEYKKRLEAIQKSRMSEEEKQKAIQALEAEYQIKRTEAQRKGAKEAKAVALMEAIVNTASGVARAFKDYMFPLSAVIAGIVGALGAVQIALIARQPIPLAQGAVFEKPTRFFTESGQAYLAGEAGPEILGSEKKIREIIRQELGHGKEINIAVPIKLEIGNTTLMKEIVQKVKLAGKTGEIRLDVIRAAV